MLKKELFKFLCMQKNDMVLPFGSGKCEDGYYVGGIKPIVITSPNQVGAFTRWLNALSRNTPYIIMRKHKNCMILEGATYQNNRVFADAQHAAIQGLYVKYTKETNERIFCSQPA